MKRSLKIFIPALALAIGIYICKDYIFNKTVFYFLVIALLSFLLDTVFCSGFRIVADKLAKTENVEIPEYVKRTSNIFFGLASILMVNIFNINLDIDFFKSYQPNIVLLNDTNLHATILFLIIMGIVVNYIWLLFYSFKRRIDQDKKEITYIKHRIRVKIYIYKKMIRFYVLKWIRQLWKRIKHRIRNGYKYIIKHIKDLLLRILINFSKIRFRFLILILVLTIFQSCKFIKPIHESKRKQKALQSKIDSLKNEHEKLETELKEIDHVLGMIEYSDSVFLKNDSLNNKASNN